MFEDVTQWEKVSTVFERCFWSKGKAAGRRMQVEAHSSHRTELNHKRLKNDLNTKPDTLSPIEEKVRKTLT